MKPTTSLKTRLASIPTVLPTVRWLRRTFRPKKHLKDHRADLLDLLPHNARCAELGVWRGDFSDRILKLTNPTLLVLVDPWQFVETYNLRWYGGVQAKNQHDMDLIYESVRAKFENQPAVRIERRPSQEFLRTTSEEFDWIYIDGDHSEEPVYQDLVLSWARIVPGGVIAGDDFYWRDADGSLPVKAAVERFVSERNCEFRLIGSQFVIQRN